MSSSSYSPRYVTDGDVDDLPLTDPSRFANQQETVLDAVENAETQLDWDINSGDEIDDPVRIHAEAVKAYATYVLKTPSASPGSRRGGDSADSGEQRRAVAQDYKAMYEDKIGAIRGARADEDDDPDTYTPPHQFQSF